MPITRPLLGVAGVVLTVLLGACSGQTPVVEVSSARVTAPVGDGATARQVDAEADTQSSPAPEPTAQSNAQDRAAGVLQAEVPDVGDGEFVTAPGTAAAPNPSGRVKSVAVQVEGGLPADPETAADFVLTTLNDPRGWPSDGWSFSRTDDLAEADIVVLLASPQTSADLCRPLVTGGKLSCREGRRAIITWYRWVKGSTDYGQDRTGYRQYVVNHEVGHALGHGHVGCPGAGRPAPVMMQQTKGLKSCAPNPWVEPA